MGTLCLPNLRREMMKHFTKVFFTLLMMTFSATMLCAGEKKEKNIDQLKAELAASESKLYQHPFAPYNAIYMILKDFEGILTSIASSEAVSSAQLKRGKYLLEQAQGAAVWITWFRGDETKYKAAVADVWGKFGALRLINKSNQEIELSYDVEAFTLQTGEKVDILVNQSGRFYDVRTYESIPNLWNAIYFTDEKVPFTIEKSAKKSATIKPYMLKIFKQLADVSFSNTFSKYFVKEFESHQKNYYDLLDKNKALESQLEAFELPLTNLAVSLKALT